MPKDFATWMRVITGITVVMQEYVEAKNNGDVSIEEWLALISKALTVLNTENVTLDELGEMLRSLGPLIALIRMLEAR